MPENKDKNGNHTFPPSFDLDSASRVADSASCMERHQMYKKMKVCHNLKTAMTK